MRKILLLAALSACVTFTVNAQEHFYDFFKFGKNFTPERGMYYSHSDYLLLQGPGGELWVSDGTAGGTSLLADCSTDPNASFGEFAATGRYTFFILYCNTGKEIWVTDGTPAGTKRYNKAKLSKYSNGHIGAFNGSLFYTYILDDNHYQLRRVDTTFSKDTAVRNFVKGYDNTHSFLPSSDSFIYFNHIDSIFRIGRDMGAPQLFWQEGTKIEIIGFEMRKNVLLWSKRDYSKTETHFYVSKETVNTAKKAAIYKDWYYIKDIEVTGNNVFFSVAGDLYKVDAGTLAVLKLTTLSAQVSYYGGELAAYGGKIYFQGYSGLGPRTELWSTNAANTSIQLITVLSPDTNAQIGQMLVANNTLFFNAYTRSGGRELYRSLGTSSSTAVLKDIMPGSESSILGYPNFYGYGPPNSSAAMFKNKLFFSAYSNAYGNEPWISDGTAVGTALFKDINDDFYYGDQEVSHFMVAGDYLFLSANDSLDGAELWRTDGTTNGTLLVHNISPSILPTEFGDYTEYRNKLFMSAFSLVDGNELYTSNGKAGSSNSFFVTAGSLLNSSSPHTLIVKAPYLYYLGRDNLLSADNLYRSSGSRSTTAPLNKGVGNSYTNASQLALVGNSLYFSAELTATGVEPMVSDGTITGTKLLKDIRTGAASSNPAFFCGDGSRVFFSATDASGMSGIYGSDGTASGTLKTFEFQQSGFANTRPDTMFCLEGKVFFRQMYTGGKFPNTTMLAAWEPQTDSLYILQPLSGETYSDPRYIKVMDGKVVFSAAGTQSAYEPWITDGSRAGTFMLKDVMAGSGSSNPGGFAVYNGLVYFSASDAAHGREAWVSDGTAQGTRLLWDIEPGTGNGNPTAFAGYKGYVYMAADQGERTQSLFRIQADSCQQYALRLRNLNTYNTMCRNAQASLFVESGFDNQNIKWYRNDSLLSFTNDTIKTGIPGMYHATVDSQGCHTRSNDISIQIQPNPDVRVRYSADSTFCEGSSLVMTQPDQELQTRWFKNSTFVSTGSTFSITIAGKVYAVGTDALGCSDTSNILNPIRYPMPLPAITRSHDTLFCAIDADSFQWTLNNIAINKATGKFLKLGSSGNYVVEAYSTHGCKGVSALYKYTNVFVQTVDAPNIHIYPNPANKTLTVEAEAIQSLKVLDATGRICLESHNGSSRLDVSSLDGGVYVLLVETGSAVFSITFLKED